MESCEDQAIKNAGSAPDLERQTLQILTTAVTFLLFGVIYTAVYLLTSRFYYRIVTPAHS